MISVYLDGVKDLLYPRKKGVLSSKNKAILVNEVSVYSKEDIKKLRLRLSLSHALFAKVMNVSEKTVEFWESGHSVPSGSAMRLLCMLEHYPDILLETDTVELAE